MVYAKKHGADIKFPHPDTENQQNQTNRHDVEDMKKFSGIIRSPAPGVPGSSRFLLNQGTSDDIENQSKQFIRNVENQSKQNKWQPHKSANTRKRVKAKR